MRRTIPWGLVGALALLWTVGGFGTAWLGFSRLSEQLLQSTDIQHTAASIAYEGISKTLGPAGRGSEAAAGDSQLNILLMGVDQRPDEARVGDPGRTDSMLLVSVDPSGPSAAMISIPRDLWVKVPGYGEQRINTAYRTGELQRRGLGPELAKQTVATLLGVPVHRYALIDMKGLRLIIDQLGGIDVDVPRTIVDEEFPTDNYGVRTLIIRAGHQRMDGETALAYARTRHPDSDFGRMARQQQVLAAIRARATELGIVPRLPSLIGPLLETVRTDLAPSEILALATLSQRIGADQVKALVIGPELVAHTTGFGGAYLLVPTPQLQPAVAAFLSSPPPLPPVEVLNGSFTPGLAARAASLLQDEGFEIARVADARATPHSLIQVPPGWRGPGERAARVLGLPGSAIEETLETPGGSPRLRIVLGPDFEPPR